MAKLALEFLGLLAAVGGAAALVRRSRRNLEGPAVAAIVLGALAFAFAVANLANAGSELDQARRHAVSSRAGLEHCLGESLSGGPLVPVRPPFLNWVKQRLPAHAVYALAPYAGPPDSWCVTLVLLPSLPVRPGGTADWTITFGMLPPDLKARIQHHDPSVQVFAPGYALARGAAR